jgi:hypothetical protein
MSDNPIQSYKPKIKEAGGAGNCFFYAVFDAVQNIGQLNSLKTMLKVTPQYNLTKEDFNLKFRKLIAESQQYITPITVTYQLICKTKDNALDYYANDLVFDEIRKQNNPESRVQRFMIGTSIQMIVALFTLLIVRYTLKDFKQFAIYFMILFGIHLAIQATLLIYTARKNSN